MARAPLTILVIATCAVLFVADALGPSGGSFLSGTARGLPPVLAACVIDPAKVEAGEWWRLVAAGFVHFSLLHLAFNMLALWNVGRYVEPRLGTLRFAVVYAAALLGGDALAYATTIGTPVVTGGASGAIMGAFGAMLVLTLVLRTEREALRPAALTIGLTLVNGLGNAGISNAGHVGGLVAGSAAAFAIVTGWPSRWIAAVRAHEAASASLSGPAVSAATASPDAPAVADEWPAGSPDTLTIGVRRSTALLMVVVAMASLVIAAGMVYLVFGIVPPYDPGWPLVGLGLAVAAAVYLGLGPSQRTLTLTPLGFIQRGPVATRSVRWSDVERVFVREVRTRGGKVRQASFTFASGYAYSGPSLSLRGLRSGGVQAFVGLGLPPDELAALVERWRIHWTRHPRTLVDELPRDELRPAALLIGVVALTFIASGGLLALTSGIGPVEDLRDEFPAGRLLVRAEPRDLVLLAGDLPAVGYRQDRDSDVDATHHERAFVSLAATFPQIVVDVHRAPSLYQASDLRRERCDGLYDFHGGTPTATVVSAREIGTAAMACRYSFVDGSRAFALLSLYRNVRADVLVVTASPSISDDSAIAFARQVALAELAKIDHVAPPR